MSRSFAHRAVLVLVVVWSVSRANTLGQGCPTGMGVCPSEDADCTTDDGQEGFCHTTYLIPPSSSPFCDCQPVGNSNDPDLHIPFYRTFLEDDVQLSAAGNIQPGANVHLTGNLPAQMTLIKGDTSQSVALSSASLDIQIDSTIDGTGRSTYVVTGGSGQFHPYVFAGQPIGSSSFVVERGNGWIRWADGVLWGSLRIRTSVAGFADVVATAIGPGSVNLATDVVTLDPRDAAVELSAPFVPAISPWGIGALLLLVLAAAALRLRRP